MSDSLNIGRIDWNRANHSVLALPACALPTNEATKMETEIYDSHEKLAFRKILWSNLTRTKASCRYEAILRVRPNLGRKFDITLAHGSDEVKQSRKVNSQ